MVSRTKPDKRAHSDSPKPVCRIGLCFSSAGMHDSPGRTGTTGLATFVLLWRLGSNSGILLTWAILDPDPRSGAAATNAGQYANNKKETQKLNGHTLDAPTSESTQIMRSVDRPGARVWCTGVAAGSAAGGFMLQVYDCSIRRPNDRDALVYSFCMTRVPLVCPRRSGSI